MLKKLGLLICGIVLLMFVSCKKHHSGKCGVKGRVVHGNEGVAYIKVYVKNDASEFPGTDLSVYDSYSTTNGNGYFDISGLGKGDHYLYATGEAHSSTFHAIVKGGVPVNLKNGDHKTVNVPVSE